eukprot:CAMPEP_0206057862 /NCGR_PEP_ID=MMETSP1466-20131121/45302_1 /ASSEMBLY_ACC=CAM_ASM_001126 /TAXON_ID=44452 /ORGANISM="Pavlova gyrans, Strain CCMP608" /LENGTH=91 /DNA_ID=CAMNT_0053433149 /DNA_START=27 /DNA_END=298 /DNA_ORIENTATION=-
MPPDGFVRVSGRSRLAHFDALRQIFDAEAAKSVHASPAPTSTHLGTSALAEVRDALLAAGFRPLTLRDVALSNALNAGYLLRLALVARMFG